MKIEKRNYIIIAFAAILLLVVFAIVFISLTSKPSTRENTPLPTPTFSSPSFVITNIPTVTVTGTNTPPSVYNSSSQEKLLQKVENRKPLSESDTSAKNRLLSLLPAGEKSGFIYQTPNLNVQYVSAPNVFQVEILTIDIQKAKTEAVTWLKSQGLSQDGICNYPVEFYLNSDVLNQLRGSSIKFSPLADGC